MAVTEIIGFGSEEDFIVSCIEMMQSKDPIVRTYGRLCRDTFPAFSQAMDECNRTGAHPADFVAAVARITGTQVVMVVKSLANPGMERQMAETMLEAIRRDMDQSLQKMGVSESKRG